MDYAIVATTGLTLSQIAALGLLCGIGSLSAGIGMLYVWRL